MNLEQAFRDSNISTCDIVQIDERKRRSASGLNQYRYLYGQYHTLFQLFKKYPRRFKNYMRMTSDTFAYILSKIEEKLTKSWCNFHQPIYPEVQLVVTLRVIITGSSYSDLAATFLMGEATICTVVQNVLNAIWAELLPIHMPVPTKKQFQKIANDFFSVWNFPHCMGAIDCRHMKIKKSPHSKILFHNWKKFHSIKLQAVVDASYRFIFIEVDDCGSTHDSTTFKRSKLYRALEKGTLQIPEDDVLPHSGIILPYYFIADGAYMLQDHVMKPYRGKNLPHAQQNFKKRLSRARMVVECAFGHLVQMWVIFKTTTECTPEMATLMTECACLLRNIIIDIEGSASNTFQFDNDDTSSADTLPGDPVCDHDVVMGHVGYGKEICVELEKFLLEHPIQSINIPLHDPFG